MTGYEARGVRCLACKGLDLKSHPEQAAVGFGWCSLKDPAHFVSVAMSRNCLEFDAAPDEVVGPRDAWDKARRMFWQKV